MYACYPYGHGGCIGPTGGKEVGENPIGRDFERPGGVPPMVMGSGFGFSMGICDPDCVAPCVMGGRGVIIGEGGTSLIPGT